MPPVFRHSHLETFAACPFAYGADLLFRVGADGLSEYVCEAGADSIIDWFTTPGVGACRPVPTNEYATAKGTAFHRFAHAYGNALREHGVDADPELAATIARGFAYIDGEHSRSLEEMMVAWAQNWTFSPTGPSGAVGAIPLTTGGFETHQQVMLEVLGRQFAYQWHPDYAHVSEDLHDLLIADWKTGLRGPAYDARRPNEQLLRYAFAFGRLFSNKIKRARLELWFVNPDNPCYYGLEREDGDSGPLVWEVDLQERPIEQGIITGPVEAIATCADFSPNPGCWLCGFCEWGHVCPCEGEIQALLDASLDTGEAAVAGMRMVDRLRAALTAKKRALKAVANKHVDMVGAIPTGGGASYRSRVVLRAKVISTQRVLASAAEQGRSIEEMFGPKDTRALAEALSVSSPFHDDGVVDGLRLELATEYGFFGDDAKDDEMPQGPDGEPAPEPDAGGIPFGGKPLPKKVEERLSGRSKQPFAPQIDDDLFNITGG